MPLPQGAARLSVIMEVWPFLIALGRQEIKEIERKWKHDI